MHPRLRPGQRVTVSAERPWAIDPEGEFIANVPEMFFVMAFQVARRQEYLTEQALRSLDVSAMQWRVLVAIHRVGECTMNQLAARSAVDRTTLTRMVDQLVAMGLVTRTTPPEDRRQVRIAQTAEGARTMDEGWALVSASQHRTMQGVDRDQLRAAIRTMQAVVVRLADDPAAVGEVLGIARDPAP